MSELLEHSTSSLLPHLSDKREEFSDYKMLMTAYLHALDLWSVVETPLSSASSSSSSSPNKKKQTKKNQIKHTSSY
jgi:hypothetical protein